LASTLTKRPLPALVSLLALLLLTALVWWRVLHRSDGHDHAATCPSPTKTVATGVTLPAPGSVTVAMLNSTTRAGIASKARNTLIADGFKVPSDAANDSAKKLNKITTTAEIRFGPTGKRAASLVRYYFPGATMVSTTAKSAVVVVSLGKKYHAVATPAAVKLALKGDKVAVASPSPTPTSSSSASC
jgi:LytR cell envelope-related transcriptional attenuator